MATNYGTGKAGQYAKGKAYRFSVRIIWIMVATAMFGSMVSGVLIGLFWAWRFPSIGRVARFFPWYIVGLEGLLLAFLLISFRILKIPLDNAWRQRVRWLRGGQTEGLIAWHLNDLPADWHLFHNVQLQENFDIDHVLIGPSGLFCISAKSQRGMYRVEPNGQYLLNGQETDHVHKAQQMAMQLKDRLTEILGEVPWIQPVLIAPFAFVDFPTKQKRAWVAHEGNLPDLFENAGPALNKAEIKRCAKAVEMVALGSKRLYKRSGRDGV